MRFESIELARYGRFTDETLVFPKRHPDFHIVLGGNEAGKSTLRQALHDLLFGIPMSTAMSFLHDGPNLAVNGVISRESETLAFGRRRKRSGGLVGPGDEPLAPEQLDAWLGDVTPAFHDRMFGLDHKRLEAGSLAMLQSQDNVDSVLFQAAAGVSALNAVLASLQQEASSLWMPRRSRERAWYMASDRLADADTELKSASVRPTAWADAARDHRRLQEAFEAAQAQHARILVQVRELERMRRIAPLLAQIGQYESVLGAADDAVSPYVASQDALLQLRELRARIVDYPIGIEQGALRMALLWQQLEDTLGQLGWSVPDRSMASLQALVGRLPASPRRQEIAHILDETSQSRARVEVARKALEEREAERAALVSEIEAQPVTELNGALVDALEAAQAAGDLDARRAQARLHTAGKRSVLDTCLLRFPGVGVEELVVMQPWPAAVLQEQIQRRQRLQADLDSLYIRRVDAGLEQETARLELEQFRRSRQAVTRDDIMGARRERDALWERFLKGDSTLTVESGRYASLVLHADTLADRHLEAVEDAARLQVLEHRYERSTVVVRGLDQAHTAAQQALKAHDSEWLQRCAERGLPERAPVELQAWQAEREAALRAHEQWVHAATELASLEAQYTQLLNNLGAALGLTVQNMASACEQARRRVAEASQMRARREARMEQLSRIERQLPGLQQVLQQCRTDLETSLARRADILIQAGLPEQASDAYIKAALGLLTDVEQLVGQLRQCAEEGERMAAELARYREMLAAMAQRLGDARYIDEEAEIALQRWLVELEHDLQAMRDRADARARLQALNRQLLEEGEGRTRQAMEAELDQIDPARMAEQSEALSAALEQAAGECSRLAVECDQSRKALEAVSGGDRAAQAEARRQEALADLAEIGDRYVQLRAQHRLLERVMERYRHRRQGPLLARAGEIFSRLTRGAHVGLVVDDEVSLHARRADGRLTPLHGLSDGTRDQLYLALRLSALELYLDHATPLPFIADDLFVNYDDGRAVAGLLELAQVARRTQVIYLTHHAHVVELARESLGDQLRVIELTGDSRPRYTE